MYKTKGQFLLKDRIIVGTIAGMIATLFKDIPNYILWNLSVVKYLYFHLAASALLDLKDVYSIYGIILGIVIDVINGGALGLIIMFLFKWTGQDYWWYKGIVMGNIIWLFVLGLLINWGAAKIVPNEPLFRIASLIDHQIYGLLTAYLICRWYPE